MRVCSLLLPALFLGITPFTSWADVPVAELPGWQLVWHDEFEGDTLDLDAWEALDLRQSHNNEKQYYLPEQNRVVDGVLRITATDEPKGDKKYRAGRVWTRQQWTHGRFEARIKMPTTKGMWPAYWLLPRDVKWPSGGEIDILEGFGSDPSVASSAYHWGANWEVHKYLSHPHHAEGADGAPVDYHKGFHLYAVEWEPTELRFYVNGEQHFKVTQDEAPISKTPMAIVLNLAVGGWFDGDPDATTQFPQTLDVDYVRVWQRSESHREEFAVESIEGE